MTDKLTGSMFRQMVLNAAAEIETNRQQINDLNVFPVPDGDTGTNMSLTLGAGAAELKNFSDEHLDKVADKVAGSLLRGARGNSGVILSLLFRGMSRTFKGAEAAGSKLLSLALTEGVNAAYGAVMKPAEGTILTVSRVAAETASKLSENEQDIELLLEASLEAAKLALADTVNQNPVLKKANVVDAGGMGYCCILNGMLAALRGEISELAASDYSVPSEKADFSQFETEDIRFAYCTEVIIRVENEKDPIVLRDFAGRLGDSLVMAADEEYIKLHVHVNDPGAIMTEALTYGSLEKVKVENMKLQHNEIIFNAPESSSSAPAEPKKKYGIVTVCAGDGMADVFKELGADYIVTGGQTMNPSTEDILKGVEAANAETVFILPNNKNIIMAAQQCKDLAESEIVVISSKTVPQGISAMLTFDDTASTDEITEAMGAAIGQVQTAQITYAARDSDFDGHSIAAGEYLCLLEGALIANSNSIDDVTNNLIASLKSSDPALITVYYGSDVTEDEANLLADTLGEALNGCETSVIYGGQPVYYYMISAE